MPVVKFELGDRVRIKAHADVADDYHNLTGVIVDDARNRPSRNPDGSFIWQFAYLVRMDCGRGDVSAKPEWLAADVRPKPFGQNDGDKPGIWREPVGVAGPLALWAIRRCAQLWDRVRK